MADSSLHDCKLNSVEDFTTKEMVCIKCGKVIAEPENHEIYVSGFEARAMGAEDHYAGNDLLNSETENMDFVNMGNRGLAFRYTGGKDFKGSRVKGKLNDSYRSGCIAGGKEVILKEDPLTHEVAFKFDMYDKPMLRMIKERAVSELSRYNLNTVEMTIVSREVKRIVSRLFFSEMRDFAWMAAVLNADVLKEKDSLEIEQAMYQLIEPIRVKLLSRCNSMLATELVKQEPIPAKP